MAFDSPPSKEVWAVFLDISKTFDKVWHDGLMHKLKRNGVEGDMLQILVSFLSNRQQRVTINGNKSGWASVEAGVPQGSIHVGPSYF